MKKYPTPKTDNESFSIAIHGELVPAKFARELEQKTAQILDALKDSERVHAMMLRGEIAWDAAKIRHLLGNEDLLNMLYRCEAWFSTLPEGRIMQLECQRIITLHNEKSPDAGEKGKANE